MIAKKSKKRETRELERHANKCRLVSWTGESECSMTRKKQVVFFTFTRFPLTSTLLILFNQFQVNAEQAYMYRIFPLFFISSPPIST
jgi:hypothetical protein